MNFEDVIDDIAAFIEELFKDDYDIGILYYTGYNYNINAAAFNYLNKETEDCPLYIRFIDKPEQIRAFVEERNMNSRKIILNINLHSYDPDFLKYNLQHEFVHIREMYAREDIDVL